MKIPDIGDVMNKFEVLGIVGEGERSRLMLPQNVTMLYINEFLLLQQRPLVWSRGSTLTNLL